MHKRIDIVFDGPPGPVAGRFVEVEDASGKSINYGEWIQRPDGYWALRLPPTVREEDYNLCDLENSNLRKCLHWAATFLPVDKLIQLRDKIEKPFDEGGVSAAGEEEHEEMILIKKLCVKAAGLLREVINSPTTKISDELDTKNWYGRAEQTASALMEFDPPAPEASLVEIRNAKEVTNAR
jgi:hypothetical protein